MLLLMSAIGVAFSCLSNYTLLSGARTYYYHPVSHELEHALVMPSTTVPSVWLRDPEAQWV